jgi:hypothetical protein
MSARLIYDEMNPIFVAFWLRDQGRKTNVEIAEYFRTTDSNISKWRKKYPKFDQAIRDPNGIMTKDIYDGLSLLTSTKDKDDTKNALGLMVKFGFGSSKGIDHQIKEEIERQLDKSDSKHDETKAMKIFKNRNFKVEIFMMHQVLTSYLRGNLASKINYVIKNKLNRVFFVLNS